MYASTPMIDLHISKTSDSLCCLPMILLDDLTPADIDLLLEAVDAGAMGSNETDGHSDSTGEMPPPASPPTKPSHRNEYRLRVRREIQRLREEAAALEHRLGAMGNYVVHSSSTLATAPVWRRIAQQQKLARSHAQQENARLREAVERHLKAARALKRILWKRSLMSPLGSFSGGITVDPTFWPPIRVHHFNDMEHQIDKILGKAGILQFITDLQEVSILEDSDNRAKSVNVRCVRVLPFDYISVRDRVWSPSAIMPHGDAKYDMMTWSDDLVISRSETLSELRHVEVVTYTQLVLRRFIKADRTVHFYDMHYLIKSDHPTYNNIQVHGQGCYDIESVRAISGHAPQSIVRCWEHGSLHGGAVRESDYIREIVRKSYESHFNSVENMLMDAVIKLELNNHHYS